MVDAAVPAEGRETAPDGDAARLLGIVGDVVRELHPGAPVAAIGLDAPIDSGLGVDAHFAAKRELARVPVLGSLLRRLGTCFVDRVDPAAGVEDVRELEAAVQRGEHVVVFAEGGFGRAPGLRAFHLGAFAASAATGVPVVPVVLQGTRSLLRDTRWLPARHPLALCMLAPEAPDGGDWAAAVRLRDRVRGAMLPRCGEPDLAR